MLTNVFTSSIECGLFDTCQFFDLRQGVLPGLVELQRLLELVLVAPGPSALPAAGSGGSEPFLGSLRDHVPLKLGQSGHEREQ